MVGFYHMNLDSKVKALANEDTLLRTQKMCLILFRNILCPQLMFPSLRSMETQYSFCVPRVYFWVCTCMRFFGALRARGIFCRFNWKSTFDDASHFSAPKLTRKSNLWNLKDISGDGANISSLFLIRSECRSPKLLSFRGKAKEFSPRARIRSWLG